MGLLADRLWGEPPATVHPVARFGSTMARLEQRWWRDDRRSGSRFALVGIGWGTAAGVAVSMALRPAGRPGAAGVSTAVSVALASAGRALGEAAHDVGRALAAGDLPRARSALPALVGRDPSELDVPGVARAVVESLAENTVDAVVAPALWGALAGAPGALGHRAANTLDAMVGYRNARFGRFGWASARADDLANWVPARVTALAVAAVRPAAAARVWRAVRCDAPAHPSPNAGVAEAAFAGALGLRLGGPSRYGSVEEVRPELGGGRAPEAADIDRAVRLSRHVTVAVGSLLAVPALWSTFRRVSEVGGR